MLVFRGEEEVGIGAKVGSSSIAEKVLTAEIFCSIFGHHRLLGHLGLLQISVCLVYERDSFLFCVESFQSCNALSFLNTPEDRYQEHV